MSKNIIYVNGKFSSEDEASISPLNRGLMYGDGIFETFRGYGGKVFAIGEHFARLQSAADFLKMNVDFSAEELGELISELLNKNSLIDKDSRIRLTLIRGRGTDGLFPDLSAKSEIVITAEEVSSGVRELQQKGIEIALVESIKVDPRSPLASHKTLNYIPGIVALQEVREKGGDEGIYLNYEGYIVEGVTSNIFIVKSGRLKTPPLSSGLLPGITRDSVIKCAAICNIDVEETSITKEDLLKADEIFITSSVREVMPVIKFEGKGFNVGPATKEILSSYREFVKKSLIQQATP
ncbi:MAG: aminotransferase class IV [bacterium]|nr:aminotransferase class IV [bacterium]